MELLEFCPDSNYEDRRGKIEPIMRLYHLRNLPKEIRFEITLKDREDDTIEISCDVNMLLEKIGKTMQHFDD